MKKKSVAVIIITNGPGELSTWVKPLVDNLDKLNNSSNKSDRLNFSLNLILVPCPNANGTEYGVAKSWNKFELITEANTFWQLLIRPYKYAKWPKKGIVIFLGGDQLWSVLLAKRLGYINITYAEWIARWPRWNYIIAAMNRKVKKRVPRKYRYKCRVIGDLMADITNNKEKTFNRKGEELIALLPGSKKAKLLVGIPYFLEIADHIHSKNKNIKIIIPIAPTTSISEYLFFQSNKNPIAKYYSSKIKKINPIKNSNFNYIIETSNNTKIYLIKKHPCFEVLKSCTLAITTVGANTAELSALTLPMIVVLPTQHLGVMKAWDGILGIIGKINIINKLVTFIIKKWYLKKKKFFAWPNIKANRLIVPERIGNVSPEQIANEALFLVKNKKYLKKQKENLSKQRGQTGALEKLSYIIFNSIKKLN